jgi:Uma2 family endonuclease
MSADTSAESDRGVKVPLYARAGISAAWLVDLAGERVVVHAAPAPEGYRTVHEARRGGRLRLDGLPGLDLAVADVLGTA